MLPSIRRAAPSLLVALLCLAAPWQGCRSSQEESLHLVPQIGVVDPRRAYFSPTDEDRLLLVQANGRVLLVDLLPSAHLLANLRAGAIDASFSPDGRFIATVGLDGRVRWWAADGSLQWVSGTGHKGPARAVAVSSDLIISGGEDGDLRLWNLDGSPLGPALHAHEDAVVSVDISSQNDLLSMAGDEAMILWKKSEEADPSTLPTYQRTVLYRPETRRFGASFSGLLRHGSAWGWDHAAEFSPEGDLVAGALFDRSLRIWNTEGRVQAIVLKAHLDRPLRALAFSAQGDRIATAGFDGSLRFWNLDGSPQLAGTRGAHNGPIYSVSFSRSGQWIATTGRDNRLRVWKRKGQRAFSLDEGRQPQISTVALANSEPVLAVANRDGSVRTFGLDGRELATMAGTGGIPFTSLAFSPGNDVLVGGGGNMFSGVLLRWERNGQIRGKLHSFATSVDAVAFDPSGNLAVGTNPFQLWKRDGGSWAQQIRYADRVISIDFTPGGDFIVTGSVLGHLHVWSPDGKIRAYRPKKGIEVAGGVAVTPGGDSFIAALGMRQTLLQEFDLDLNPRGEPFEGHLGESLRLAFAPDGRLVAGGEDGIVRLWTLPGRELQTIFVGLPINQLGFWRDLLWVRADGEWLFFYHLDGTLVSTILLDPGANGPIVLTPDAWYSAPAFGGREVRMYESTGQLRSASRTLSRRSFERVMEAFE